MADLRKLGLGATKAALSIAAIAFATMAVDREAVGPALVQIQPATLALALALLTLGNLAQALRYGAICSWLGRPIARTAAIAATYSSIWFNQILPTGLGGEAVRAILMHSRLGAARALLAAVLDRGFGVVAMVAFLSVSAGLIDVAVPQIWKTAAFALFAVIALGAAALLLWPRPRALRRVLPGWIGRALLLWSTASRVLRKLALAPFEILVFALSLGFYVWSFAVCLAGLGVDLSAPTYVFAIIWVLVLQQIPISWGGWGVREAASISVFPLVGASRETALIASVLYGLFLLISAVPGAFSWQKGRASPDPLKPA